MASRLDKYKAAGMLNNGFVRGKPLTPGQKELFSKISGEPLKYHHGGPHNFVQHVLPNLLDSLFSKSSTPGKNTQLELEKESGVGDYANRDDPSFNDAVPGFLKNLLFNKIRPIQYPDKGAIVQDFLGMKDEDDKFGIETKDPQMDRSGEFYGIDEEAWRMALGFENPQIDGGPNKYILPSQYLPEGEDYNSNLNYYTYPTQHIDWQEMVNHLNQYNFNTQLGQQTGNWDAFSYQGKPTQHPDGTGLVEGETLYPEGIENQQIYRPGTQNISFPSNSSGDVGGLAHFRRFIKPSGNREIGGFDPLARFDLDIGTDEDGRHYISYRDVYNFNDKTINSVIKPFGWYDRMYVDYDENTGMYTLPEDYNNEGGVPNRYQRITSGEISLKDAINSEMGEFEEEGGYELGLQDPDYKHMNLSDSSKLFLHSTKQLGKQMKRFGGPIKRDHGGAHNADGSRADGTPVNIPKETSMYTDEQLKFIKEQVKVGYDFNERWLQSEMARNMLIKSTGSYEEADFLLKARLYNLRNSDFEISNKQPKKKPNTGGQSSSMSGDVTMFPYGYNLFDLGTHEWAHSSDRPLYPLGYLDIATPSDVAGDSLFLGTQTTPVAGIFNFVNDLVGSPLQQSYPSKYTWKRLIPSKDNQIVEEFRKNKDLFGNYYDKKIEKDSIEFNRLMGRMFSGEKLTTEEAEYAKTLKKRIKKNKKWVEYITNPTEVRARIQSIRSAGERLGIYNPFTEKVDSDIFDMLDFEELEPNNPGFDALQQLYDIFDKEEIIYLLNNMANVGDGNSFEIQDEHGGESQFISRYGGKQGEESWSAGISDNMKQNWNTSTIAKYGLNSTNRNQEQITSDVKTRSNQLMQETFLPTKAKEWWDMTEDQRQAIKNQKQELFRTYKDPSTQRKEDELSYYKHWRQEDKEYKNFESELLGYETAKEYGPFAAQSMKTNQVGIDAYRKGWSEQDLAASVLRQGGNPKKLSASSFNKGAGIFDTSKIIKKHGGPHDPKTNAPLYQVQVTTYPYGYEGMQSGHSESSVLTNLPSHFDLTKGSLKGAKPYGNSWYYGAGNIQPTYNAATDYVPGIRQFIVNMNESQLQHYLEQSKTIQPSDGGFYKNLKEAIGHNLPLGKTGYNFVKNNCGDATCRLFDIDASETDQIVGAVTDPNTLHDYMLEHFKDQIEPGSITGTKSDTRKEFVDAGNTLFGMPNNLLKTVLYLDEQGYDLDWELDALVSGASGGLNLYNKSIGNVWPLVEDAAGIAKYIFYDGPGELIGNVADKASELVDEFSDPGSSLYIPPFPEYQGGSALIDLFVGNKGVIESYNPTETAKTAEDASGGTTSNYVKQLEKYPGRPQAKLASGEWYNEHGSLMHINGSMIWRSPDEPGFQMGTNIFDAEGKLPNIMDIPTLPGSDKLSDEDIQNIIKFLEKKEYGGPNVKGRRGVRANPDGSTSTHIMKHERLRDGTWVAFPTLFQNSVPYEDDNRNWVDMSTQASNYKGDWENSPTYQEALRRGEVYKFANQQEAREFAVEGKGWKTKGHGGHVGCSECQRKMFHGIPLRKAAGGSNYSPETVMPERFQNYASNIPAVQDSSQDENQYPYSLSQFKEANSDIKGENINWDYLYKDYIGGDEWAEWRESSPIQLNKSGWADLDWYRKNKTDLDMIGNTQNWLINQGGRDINWDQTWGNNTYNAINQHLVNQQLENWNSTNFTSDQYLDMIYKESAGKQSTTSGAGAKGIAQFMPETFEWMKTKGWIPSTSSIDDPAAQSLAQRKYLDYLYTDRTNIKSATTTEERQARSFAAYNMGPAKFDKFWAGLSDEDKKGGWKTYYSKLNNETKAYVLWMMDKELMEDKMESTYDKANWKYKSWKKTNPKYRYKYGGKIHNVKNWFTEKSYNK